MTEERYPGEHRALGLFLHDLHAAMRELLGRDNLLFHRVERALRQGSLEALRSARHAFLLQPEAIRQDLVQVMLGRVAPAASRTELLERYRAEDPRPFVRFEFDRCDADPAEDLRVDLVHELMSDRPLRVLIGPGTLPSAAAQALRAIADRIETDRRLLSERHWRHKASLDERGGKPTTAKLAD